MRGSAPSTGGNRALSPGQDERHGQTGREGPRPGEKENRQKTRDQKGRRRRPPGPFLLFGESVKMLGKPPVPPGVSKPVDLEGEHGRDEGEKDSHGGGQTIPAGNEV